MLLGPGSRQEGPRSRLLAVPFFSQSSGQANHENKLIETGAE